MSRLATNHFQGTENLGRIQTEYTLEATDHQDRVEVVENCGTPKTLRAELLNSAFGQRPR